MRPPPRGKGLKSIQFFKVWIGPNAFYRLIESSAWKSRDTSALVRPKAHSFISTDKGLPSRYILMKDLSLTANPPFL